MHSKLKEWIFINFTFCIKGLDGMNLSELSNLTKIQEANLQEIQKEINRKTIFSGNKLTDKIKENKYLD